MQRIALVNLGRMAGVSVKRAAPTISGRANVPALSRHAVSVRHVHYTRPVFAAGGMTFLDRREATDRIMQVVGNFEKVDNAKVTETASFKDDLALDSLDAVEVVMAIEDEFSIEIPDTEADRILSVADAVTYVISHPTAK